MDLIDRQQAIGKIKDWMKFIGYSHGERNVMKCTIQMLEELPSAQKTGKWIIFPPCIEEICMCSNCKTKFKEAYQHSNICPNCGASMIGCE